MLGPLTHAQGKEILRPMNAQYIADRNWWWLPEQERVA
jgi:hypothetical protein